ncbi:MAG: M20/M25/M40 family metallo-hydrolase [Deltaproteobacteria bacterium]|nr:M20/M25/M40 family metallo-hydrolase [Deltaproteobacteria bacterium]
MTRALFAGLWILAALLTAIVVRAARSERHVEPITPPAAFEVSAQATARLGDAIRIPTVWQGASTSSSAFEQLHRHLEASFPRVHRELSVDTLEGFSLLYTWKGRDPKLKPLLLMAHQDVVPVSPGTEGDWTHPPFSGAVEDGFVYGRGTLDIKAALMAELEAVEALLARGFSPERTVMLSFGHDEETGGLGAAAVARELEKRGVRLHLVLDEGSSIVEGLVPGVSEAIAVIGIAEKGYVSLELSAKGDGGHSSMPPPHTAIGVLAAAVARLEDNPFPSNRKYAGAFFAELAPAMPFTMRLVFRNLWLFGPVVEPVLARTRPMNAAIRTTTAVTMFAAGVKDNVLPQDAHAVANFRIIPGETIASTIARVRSIIDDPRIDVRQVVGGSIANEPSPISDVSSETYRRLRTTIRQVAGDGGLVVAPYLVLGATDARHFARISDSTFRFVMNLARPDDLPRIHGTNERIAVASYERMIRFYAQLIRNVAGPA